MIALAWTVACGSEYFDWTAEARFRCAMMSRANGVFTCLLPEHRTSIISPRAYHLLHRLCQHLGKPLLHLPSRPAHATYPMLDTHLACFYCKAPPFLPQPPRQAPRLNHSLLVQEPADRRKRRNMTAKKRAAPEDVQPNKVSVPLPPPIDDYTSHVDTHQRNPGPL